MICISWKCHQEAKSVWTFIKKDAFCLPPKQKRCPSVPVPTPESPDRAAGPVEMVPGGSLPIASEVSFPRESPILTKWSAAIAGTGGGGNADPLGS